MTLDRPKRPRVDFEVERRRWRRVDPVAGVGKGKGQQSGFVATGISVDEEIVLVGDFSRKRLLREAG